MCYYCNLPIYRLLGFCIWLFHLVLFLQWTSFWRRHLWQLPLSSQVRFSGCFVYSPFLLFLIPLSLLWQQAWWTSLSRRFCSSRDGSHCSMFLLCCCLLLVLEDIWKNMSIWATNWAMHDYIIPLQFSSTFWYLVLLFISIFFLSSSLLAVIRRLNGSITSFFLQILARHWGDKFS